MPLGRASGSLSFRAPQYKRSFHTVPMVKQAETFRANLFFHSHLRTLLKCWKPSALPAPVRAPGATRWTRGELAGTRLTAGGDKPAAGAQR
jgi:hypothetical protein